MTPTEVRDVVQESLDRHTAKGTVIKVVGVDPEPKDGQWQVMVEPVTAEPEPRYYYYEILGKVEDDVYDEKGIFVFLVPAPEGSFHYSVDGQLVEVKERRESLVAGLKKNPLSHAFFEPNGRYVGGPLRVSKKVRDLLERAVRLHLAHSRQAA